MRRGLAATAAALLAVAGLLAEPASPAAAATPTVVVTQFDDGYADQYPALASLSAHGLHATFFVNSGPIMAGADERKVFAETIPPADPYATRAPANVKSADTPQTIEGYVLGAEQHGGRMVRIVLHHTCDRCDPYSITQANFDAILDWLAAHGSIVQTTTEVIGGPVRPPVPA